MQAEYYLRHDFVRVNLQVAFARMICEVLRYVPSFPVDLKASRYT